MHWGVFTLPEYFSEWYPRLMCYKGNPVYWHHKRKYGKNFNYRDFIELFKVEKFNAAEWVSAAKDCGVRFIMPVAEHHDGFKLYDSVLNEWTSVKKGPERDFLAEIITECKKQDLIFSASSHRAEHFWFLNGDKTVGFANETQNEEYREFYGACENVHKLNNLYTLLRQEHGIEPTNEWLEDWLVSSCELIDKYQPSSLFFDWWVSYKAFRPYMKKFLAYYYNRSVANVILPLAAGIIFASSENPMNNIELYRWAFPICGLGCIIFVFFVYFGTEERTIVHKEYVAQVKFLEGTKQLLTNKYFWIITLYTVFIGVRGNINMYLWICNYAISGQNGSFALGVCNILLNNALVSGMLIGPFLIKKLGKRNVMLISTLGFMIMAFMQLFTLNQPYHILVAIFFQNLFNGLSYISTIMVPDVLDYQQWKTGKRLEGFWQNFSAFVTTIFGFFTSALMPLFMSFGGVGFGDNIDEVLRDKTVMMNTFESVTWLGIIFSVLSVIPIFFYDLSEKKHENYILALRVRAAVRNYENNELDENDINFVKEAVKLASSNDDKFIKEELSQYNCLNKITGGTEI